MAPRLMARSFGVERVSKERPGKDGAPATTVSRSGLQAKLNQWTANKNIVAVHGVHFEAGTVQVKPKEGDAYDADGTLVTVIFTEDKEGAESLSKDELKAGRIFAKVIEGEELGTSAFATKLNSFSKGKEVDVECVGFGKAPDDTAIGVVFFRSISGGTDEAGSDAEASADEISEPAEAELAGATA